MADDQAQPPKPRPRRRRTDIDPNAPSPPVANERRRRRKASTGDVTAGAAASKAADRPASTEPAAAPPDATTPFHVPGMSALGGVLGTDPGTVGQRDEPAITVATPANRTWLQQLDDRSPDPNVCPFLRAIGETGLVQPIEEPHPTNRCAALSEAVPQSRRQQELMCLSTGHVNCPRYLRGAAVAVETPAPVVRRSGSTSPAMLGSLVVLVMALTASIAFVLTRGGALTIAPSPSASASAPLAIVSPSLQSSAPASVASLAPATASPSPSLSPSPSVSPSPTPSVAATPRATPRSDRYQLLRACPGTPRCWIYRVRSGDNVFSIARYFGVSQDSIYQRNPWLRTRGLRAAGRHPRSRP